MTAAEFVIVKQLIHAAWARDSRLVGILLHALHLELNRKAA